MQIADQLILLPSLFAIEDQATGPGKNDDTSPKLDTRELKPRFFGPYFFSFLF